MGLIVCKCGSYVLNDSSKPPTNAHFLPGSIRHFNSIISFLITFLPGIRLALIKIGPSTLMKSSLCTSYFAAAVVRFKESTNLFPLTFVPLGWVREVIGWWMVVRVPLGGEVIGWWSCPARVGRGGLWMVVLCL